MAQKKPTLTDEQKVLFDALTKQQQQFALGILKGLNQTDAYKQAGYKVKTDAAARSQSSRMLTFANVKSFLDAMNEVAISNAIMSREEALERLSSIGRSSVSEMVEFSEHKMGTDDDGNPVIQSVWRFKDSALQDPKALAAISELTASKDGIKLKLHDPKAAIKQLADMQGWEPPKKIEHSVDEQMAELLREISSES
ncbi:TPA: terminase small subunit [Proteus mirabilis]|uniref:terminase small subunit n=1 Tax=Proteus TaxID=583 RepID=UPI0013778772|nr:MULTISPECIES: terminase small subunit [Proteus]NBM68751.1 terminase small subunit [Proteus sp. G2663]HCU0048663.1 terminase small subunit [Proteus mirabilis]HEJ9506407.1 terminase small subunit [Proteus mirabilis]HEJ9800008.1 terminase small subunit [Proteus mirabilis]